jgi:hypothetical protein
MKKSLSKIVLGLFLAAVVAINSFPLLANQNDSQIPTAEVNGYWLCTEPGHCGTGREWAHCILYDLETCDVSAQHDCEDIEVPIGG